MAGLTGHAGSRGPRPGAEPGPEGSAARPDDWLVLSIPAPAAPRAHLLVDALRRVGARAVERDGDRVLALFPPRPDVDTLATEVRPALRAALDADPELSWRRQSHSEWAARWREEQRPRRVGRLLVVPVGADPDDVGPGDVVLRLEPGVAFGTAEHATTRACLRFLDGWVRPGHRVLDIGAGSGVLAIAAALLGAAEVLAVEADGLACRAARRNVEANGVAGRVRVRELEVGPGDLRRLGRYDVVAANLQVGILRPLVPGLAGALPRDGALIVSGIVGDERDELVAVADDAGLVLADAATERGWWTGVLTRPPGR